LYSVMVNIPAVEASEKRSVRVSAPDNELLLIEWLNALLSLSDIEHMVFSKFRVTMEGTSLAGTAWGEKLDQERHEPNVEIKGATYYMLKVTEADGRFVAQCVVDV
jgi:SHS2 domain-containing protein